MDDVTSQVHKTDGQSKAPVIAPEPVQDQQEPDDSPWLFRADEFPPVPESARRAPRVDSAGLFDLQEDE